MVNWLSMAAADRVVSTPSTTAASCWPPSPVPRPVPRPPPHRRARTGRGRHRRPAARRRRRPLRPPPRRAPAAGRAVEPPLGVRQGPRGLLRRPRPGGRPGRRLRGGDRRPGPTDRARGVRPGPGPARASGRPLRHRARPRLPGAARHRRRRRQHSSSAGGRRRSWRPAAAAGCLAYPSWCPHRAHTCTPASTSWWSACAGPSPTTTSAGGPRPPGTTSAPGVAGGAPRRPAGRAAAARAAEPGPGRPAAQPSNTSSGRSCRGCAPAGGFGSRCGRRCVGVDSCGRRPARGTGSVDELELGGVGLDDRRAPGVAHDRQVRCPTCRTRRRADRPSVPLWRARRCLWGCHGPPSGARVERVPPGWGELRTALPWRPCSRRGRAGSRGHSSRCRGRVGPGGAPDGRAPAGAGAGRPQPPIRRAASTSARE